MFFVVKNLCYKVGIMKFPNKNFSLQQGEHLIISVPLGQAKQL